MKLLLMIYDVDFDDDVMEMLTACCVTGYTKCGKVLGKGKKSDPRLDDAVWPGYNCAVAVAVENDVEDKIFSAMKTLRNKLGGKGFVVYELPVMRVI
jgi:hypothetical protein